MKTFFDYIEEKLILNKNISSPNGSILQIKNMKLNFPFKIHIRFVDSEEDFIAYDYKHTKHKYKFFDKDKKEICEININNLIEILEKECESMGYVNNYGTVMISIEKINKK